jgi:hypothetical protein
VHLLARYFYTYQNARKTTIKSTSTNLVPISEERETRTTLVHQTQIGITEDFQASEACFSTEGFRVSTFNANASLNVSLK